jgi:tetrahydromethanopterin S-methyltransferase subunit F
MPLLASIADIRDVVVIVYGIIGIVFFFFAVIIALVLGFSVRGLIRSVRELLDDSVKPTVDSIKEAAETVRGTTEFVGRNAVMPIARAYGAFAGVRKGLGVLAGFNRRRAK